MRGLVVALTVVLSCGVLAPAATAQVAQSHLKPESMTVPPEGFRVSGNDAAAIAESTPEFVGERRKGGAKRVVVIRVPDVREVTLQRGGTHVAQVDIHGSTGEVLAAYDGYEAGDLLVRGNIGGTADLWWFWIGLSVLFVAPFVDLRRPRRLLHLDLAVVLALGISYAFFVADRLNLSVQLVYPPLLYLVARLAFEARAITDRGALIPHVPMRMLLVGLVVLVAARSWVAVEGNAHVVDVGIASAIGADRISKGEELYVANDLHGDTYGPVAYLAYLPFEAIWPFDGGVLDTGFANVDAIKAAALTFDLLTLLGLVLLGIRARPGPAGRRLALALGWGWAANPFTLLVLTTNPHDALVSVGLVASLLVLGSPVLRGAFLGLAAAAKFAPAAVALVFIRAWRDQGRGATAAAAAAFGLGVALPILVYLPDGGVREFWDTTLGYQLSRGSLYSPWGLWESLGWLQTLVKAATLAFLVWIAVSVPADRDLRRTAALVGAGIIAVQLPVTHWFYFYVLWLLPPVLVALMSTYRTDAEPHRSASSGPVDDHLLTGA